MVATDVLEAQDRADSNLTGIGTGGLLWGLGMPQDQRIQLLEMQLDAANRRISETERRVAKEAQERAVADSQEREKRRVADEELREKLKNVAVGGLNLSLMGAWWLVMGGVAAGFALELAHLTTLLFGCG